MDQNMKRSIILEHYQNPKNKGLIDDDTYIRINMNNESCIDEVDLMVKLEDGKIKEQGTHKELLKSSESYKNLYEKEFK